MAAVETCEIVPGDRPGTFVLRMAGMNQSHVDLAHPTRLEFEYVRRIADVLDLAAPSGAPLRVVHVGGAGMTLPRYVAALRPRSPQVVLEPAVDVTELVRRELPLPQRSGIKVRPLGGRPGIAELRDGYAEVVVLDAFAAARVPGELVTAEFFADVARVLSADGLFVLNLTDRAPFGWTRRVIAALRELVLRAADQRGAGDAAGSPGRQPGGRRVPGGGAAGRAAGARSECAGAVPGPGRGSGE